MNQTIEIWNLLHDGIITVFHGDDKNALAMFVYIPYVRRKIKPEGVSFVLKLYGVKSCVFQDFDGREESLSEACDSNTPEILSTESESMPVTLHTTLGNLILEYEGIKYFLDSGAEIYYQIISTLVLSIGKSGARKIKLNNRSSIATIWLDSF